MVGEAEEHLDSVQRMDHLEKRVTDLEFSEERISQHAELLWLKRALVQQRSLLVTNMLYDGLEKGAQQDSDMGIQRLSVTATRLIGE